MIMNKDTLKINKKNREFTPIDKIPLKAQIAKPKIFL